MFNYTGSATVETVNLNSAGLPAGTYNATNLWDGTSSMVSGSFNVNLNEKQARLFELVPVPGFTVSATPSALAIGTGGGYTDYAITVAAVGGFNGSVTLSLSGAPTGVTYGISPATLGGGSGSATLSVTNSGSAPGGSYALTVTGVSGLLTNTATVILSIGQATSLWNSGGAPDGNWTNPENWGGVVPATDSWLAFGSGSQVLTTNNFSARHDHRQSGLHRWFALVHVERQRRYFGQSFAGCAWKPWRRCHQQQFSQQPDGPSAGDTFGRRPCHHHRHRFRAA